MSNSYIGQPPVFGEFPFQILTGDGTNTYKLEFQTAGERGLLVMLDGAPQRPGIDYSSAGDVLVFSENIDLGTQIFVYGMGLPRSELTNGESIANSVPLFSVQWWPSRDNVPAGYVLADGQELSRNTYPDAALGIVEGKVPVTDDTSWLSTPTQRGKFSLGSDASLFRMPDYNGKSSGSLGAVFLRGDGEKSGGVNGLIQEDALQNITGGVATLYRAGSTTSVGALFAENFGPTPAAPGTQGAVAGDNVTVKIDASRVARTADETRPLNITGCWVIKLFGAVTNVGSADVAQLASDYANLRSDIDSKLPSDSKGVATAWANFDGTGTVTISDSFNVASITDNGVGTYTVNFLTPCDSGAYSVVAMSSINVLTGSSGVIATMLCDDPLYRQSATGFRLFVASVNAGSASALADRSSVSVTVFGGIA